MHTGEKNTDEVISHSAKPNFVFKLVMSKNLATDCVQSGIDDFCMFDSTSVSFDLGNSFGEACDEFFGIVIHDGRENLNCGKQSVGSSRWLIR